MSYKTGNLKMFKGSLKKFKKYNPVAWRNRWLFNLKVGDFVLGCDGVNHKIKEITAKPTTRMTGGSLRNIREVAIYFEDNFSCDPYYCIALKKEEVRKEL